MIQLSLGSQEQARIEINRDILYSRGARPDISLPDVYLQPRYPEGAGRDGTFRNPVVSLPAAAGPGNPESPGAAPAVSDPPESLNLSLPVPSLSVRPGRQRTGQLVLQAEEPRGAGGELSWQSPRIPLFFSAGGRASRGGGYPSWAAGSVSWRGAHTFYLSSGFRFGPSESLYSLAEYTYGFEESPPGLTVRAGLFAEHRLEEAAGGRYWPAAQLGWRFGGPRLEITPSFRAEGILDGETAGYRFRPALRFGRSGLAGTTGWQAGAVLEGVYDTADSSFSLYPGLGVTIFPGEGVSLFADLKTREVSGAGKMDLALSEPPGGGLFQYALRQEARGGVHLVRDSWDLLVRGGWQWGGFLQEDGGAFRVRYLSYPSAEAECSLSFPGGTVSNLSAYADLISRGDFRFLLENRWLFSGPAERGGGWTITVRGGSRHLSRGEADYIPESDTVLAGIGVGRIFSGRRDLSFYLDYIPRENRLEGGGRFMCSF